MFPGPPNATIIIARRLFDTLSPIIQIQAIRSSHLCLLRALLGISQIGSCAFRYNAFTYGYVLGILGARGLRFRG